MLGILLGVIYGLLAAATWFWLFQPFAIVIRPERKWSWLLLCTVAALLWPLTWPALYALSRWGKAG